MAPVIKDKRFLIGAIFVIVGIILILNNIHFIPNFIPYWVWTWQFFLVAIGIFILLTSEKTGPGIILIIIGGVFLFQDLAHDFWPDFFHVFIDDSNLFWYLLIIVVGIALIINRGRGIPGPHGGRRKHRFNSAGSVADDYIDEVSIFGGGEKIITSENFQGGNVTAIFGGSDINLLHAKLAEGVHEIEVVAVFGGWTLIIPSSWEVKVEVTSIFGGVSDKRMIQPGQIKDTTKPPSTLIIKGVALFGGGEIKSV
jgi:predicted membrane protein